LIKNSLKSISATWLAGLMLLLPLALTIAVLVWAFSLVNRFIGPGSFVGQLFAKLGYAFSSNPALQYVFGTLLLILLIYLLGLFVEFELRGPLKGFAERTLRRIPLVGSLYGVADKFVGMARALRCSRSRRAHNPCRSKAAATSRCWCQRPRCRSAAR
jgi:uncharacterized membrane protein